MDQFTTKQPAETFPIAFNFANVLGSTETIASVTSIVALDQADNSDVSLTVLNAALQSNTDTVVTTWVRAGTAGHTYVITCKILGSAGSVYELDGVLPVDSVPSTLPSYGNGMVTGPVLEPVTLDEVKTHVKIDSDTTSDEELEAMITAAREHIENITNRAILTQTWDYVLQEWPDKNYIELPFGNLQSVTSIKWKDDDGTETTLTVTTDYLVETNGNKPGRIVLPYGESWPSGTLYPSNPIVIRFICGWTTIELVPYPIKAAMKMIVADMYEMRGEPVVGQMTVIENKTIDRLLASYRLWRFA